MLVKGQGQRMRYIPWYIVMVLNALNIILLKVFYTTYMKTVFVFLPNGSEFYMHVIYWNRYIKAQV